MSPEVTHKPIRIYIGGLILDANTLYMFFCFFKLFAVVGNVLSNNCMNLAWFPGLWPGNEAKY